MHNRNFVINMVINGEKAPAFSARSLELPPEQIDNTGRIIENTRRLYSRSRTEVEQEINEAISVQQGQQQQQRPQPQSHSQATQWPVDAGARAVGQVVSTAFGSAEQGTSDKPKRKRTRTRKRKPASTDGSAPTPIPPAN
jgi:hypothetical protein